MWPIEERPVPKGDTPREWYSPTQPFPTKPPAYDGQGLAIDDLIDFTPELRAEAVKLVSRYRLGPIFTPPAVSRRRRSDRDVDDGRAGGGDELARWLRTIRKRTRCSSRRKPRSRRLDLVPSPPGRSDLPYFQGTVLSGARLTGGAGSDAACDGRAVGVGTAERGPDRFSGLPLDQAAV